MHDLHLSRYTACPWRTLIFLEATIYKLSPDNVIREGTLPYLLSHLTMSHEGSSPDPARMLMLLFPRFNILNFIGPLEILHHATKKPAFERIIAASELTLVSEICNV